MRNMNTRLESSDGASLMELMVAMGLTITVVGAALGGLNDVMKANESVVQLSGMNKSMRSAMDLMVRDFLQTGSGLPSSHEITIPSGAGAVPIQLPGPPGSNFSTEAGQETIPAVITHSEAGPTIGGIKTDVITILTADNTFNSVTLTAVADSSVTVSPSVDLDDGQDRVSAGQLMMISKGSFTTLVQVTDVDASSGVVEFTDNDSMDFNQAGAQFGTLKALNAEAPVNNASQTFISRIRMITYYLDDTIDSKHPRLVRRINNGDPLTFDNTLGTAVALDVENLQFTYDINDGANNPAAIEMSEADRVDGTGACAPDVCSETAIRKVNISMSGRTQNAVNNTRTSYRNSLQSQVSLRGMAFVDRYATS